ncbi:MAG: MotA/TolQ/ExbB proton channel family protein [Planctomycetota bacterium]
MFDAWLHVIGAGLLLLVVVCAVLAGGAPGWFVDLPSVVWVVFGTLAAWLMSCGAAAFGSISGLLRGDAGVDRETFARRLHALIRVRQLGWSVGLIGLIVGLIAMLADLSDYAKVGAALAVATLPLLYGVALSEFVFAPLASLYTARAGRHAWAIPGERGLIPLLLGGCVVAMVLILGVFTVGVLANLDGPQDHGRQTAMNAVVAEVLADPNR